MLSVQRRDVSSVDRAQLSSSLSLVPPLRILLVAVVVVVGVAIAFVVGVELIVAGAQLSWHPCKHAVSSTWTHVAQVCQETLY